MGNRFRITFCEDLPKRLYNPDKIYWLQEPFCALVEYDDEEPVRIVGRDGGEPEDQSLVRDWNWVADEMNKLDDEILELKKKLSGK